jgi:23S rRNA (uracil1939-C5)-methyltransferase
MAYAEQVGWKERIFRETLERLGGLGVPQLDPAIPSRREYHYRSKARFQVRGGRWGFFRKGSTEVVDIEECPIAEQPINRALGQIRGFVQGSWRMRALPSVLVSVEIGFSPHDRGVVVSLGLKRGLRGLAWRSFFSHVEGLKGLEVRDTRRKAAGRLLFSEGDTDLLVKAGGLLQKTPASSFSQVNRDQNARLAERVVEYAGLRGDETVLELYCGAGNLTAHLGRRAGRVIAVDSDRAAIEAARGGPGGTRSTGTGCAEFHIGRAAPWLDNNLGDLEKEPPRVVVLDPPRVGDSEAAALIARLGPSRVVYVSCNPPTMARDMKILAGAGYTIRRASVIDLFPQTGHIEGICLLEREGQGGKGRENDGERA